MGKRSSCHQTVLAEKMYERAGHYALYRSRRGKKIRTGILWGQPDCTWKSTDNMGICTLRPWKSVLWKIKDPALNSAFLKIPAVSVSGGPPSIPGLTVQWRAINHSAAVSRCLYYSYDHTQKQRSPHRTHSTGSCIMYTIFKFHNKHCVKYIIY